MSGDPQAASDHASILVVEDEYLIADHVATTLEALGYGVVGPVPTVDRALALIGRERIDAALLDANLDGASSGPIAEALSARDIPFVVLTGYGDLGLGAQILQDAPRVTKPLHPPDLSAMLARTLAPRPPG